MKNPLLSIVMPVRNAARTIGAALQSIARQSESDFELIAVDDASADASLSILREAAASDPRIRLIASPSSGIVAALNSGIRTARSDLIARMDADDEMHPRRLELQRRYLEDHRDIALVASRVELFSEEEILAGYREYIRWQNTLLTPDDIANDIYVESPLAHPSVMFRRSAIAREDVYADGEFPEDYELWLWMHERGLRVAKLPDVLLRWRDSGVRTSRVDPRYSRAAFDRLRADYLARDVRIRSNRELVVWGAGYKSRQRVRLLVERGVHVHSWIDIDPRKIGKSLWERPIRDPASLERTPKPFVLVYVTNHGAREEIAEFLQRRGYAKGVDWVAVG